MAACPEVHLNQVIPFMIDFILPCRGSAPYDQTLYQSSDITEIFQH